MTLLESIQEEIQAEIDALPEYTIPHKDNERCKKCGEWKSKDDFSKSVGNNGVCLECVNAKVRYYRRQTPKDIVNTRRKEYYKDNAAKEKARAKLRYAVKTGKVDKPTVCPICNRSDKRIDAHHTDYTKPLDVSWACSTCHRREYHPMKDNGYENRVKNMADYYNHVEGKYYGGDKDE